MADPIPGNGASVGTNIGSTTRFHALVQGARDLAARKGSARTGNSRYYRAFALRKAMEGVHSHGAASRAAQNSQLNEHDVLRRLALGQSRSTPSSAAGSQFSTQTLQHVGGDANQSPVLRSATAAHTYRWVPRTASLTRSPKSVLSALAFDSDDIGGIGSSVSVEGNIGVGKSTFLERIRSFEGLKDKVSILPEPVDKWQNVGGSNYNLLQDFYNDPKRFAYSFQSYAFITHVMQNNDAAKEKPSNLRISERSVFTYRNIFVRSLHDQELMSDMELLLYNDWFEPVVQTQPNVVPNAFVYLIASPDTCLARLKMRSREEESKIELDYLKNLHERHEAWLIGESIPTRFEAEGIVPSGKVGEALGEQSLPGVWVRLLASDNTPIVVCDNDANEDPTANVVQMLKQFFPM